MNQLLKSKTGGMRSILVVCMLMGAVACSNNNNRIPNSYVFYNGDIVTMATEEYQPSEAPKAVWVIDGIIPQ